MYCTLFQSAELYTVRWGCLVNLTWTGLEQASLQIKLLTKPHVSFHLLRRLLYSSLELASHSGQIQAMSPQIFLPKRTHQASSGVSVSFYEQIMKPTRWLDSVRSTLVPVYTTVPYEHDVDTPGEDQASNEHPYAAKLALCLGATRGSCGAARVACVIVARRSPRSRAVILEGLNQWGKREACTH